MNAFEVIKTARLTEKGTRQSEKYNQYTVVADRRANKTEIRQAMEELFKANKVKVIKVNTLNVRGKLRRQRTYQAGQAPGWKKAIVTLRKGDKIVLT
jgi:large subunit ribosomal protein L23